MVEGQKSSQGAEGTDRPSRAGATGQPGAAREIFQGQAGVVGGFFCRLWLLGCGRGGQAAGAGTEGAEGPRAPGRRWPLTHPSPPPPRPAAGDTRCCGPSDTAGAAARLHTRGAAGHDAGPSPPPTVPCAPTSRGPRRSHTLEAAPRLSLTQAPLALCPLPARQKPNPASKPLPQVPCRSQLPAPSLCPRHCDGAAPASPLPLPPYRPPGNAGVPLVLWGLSLSAALPRGPSAGAAHLDGNSPVVCRRVCLALREQRNGPLRGPHCHPGLPGPWEQLRVPSLPCTPPAPRPSPSAIVSSRFGCALQAPWPLALPYSRVADLRHTRPHTSFV